MLSEYAQYDLTYYFWTLKLKENFYKHLHLFWSLQNTGRGRLSINIWMYERVLNCFMVSNSVRPDGTGSSVHGILQARILEWVAMPSSGESSIPRGLTLCLKFLALAGGFFTTSPTWEAQVKDLPSSGDKQFLKTKQRVVAGYCLIVSSETCSISPTLPFLIFSSRWK